MHHEKQAVVRAKRLRKAASEELNTRIAHQDGIPPNGSTFTGYQPSPPTVIPTPAMQSGNMEARLGQEIINIDQMHSNGQDGSSGLVYRDAQPGPGLERYQRNETTANSMTGLSTVQRLQPAVYHGPLVRISSSNDATKRT
ncbi:hypothetical protein FJTKL_12431, partial [Diaporthe vaccinii]